ncbi:mitotic checkpoint serine/threonine-protein kinase BUB1 isoform X2 [Syngnathoides biaculeatus]|uniref:mitotic checkpoint serine/threonine-protein kinase BUB1 isoform X2 n=1 Tax=Syngnathoides biaculeatus TaxID=300417 RepID=UPI002ADDC50E|nr:mitotic checkpoint serine/threonine-protein kinase BUB1 isoform X2 [Syngnathoides biaculeatus]
MDVAACLKAFERRFSSYTGDDPLDVWLQFVEQLDQSLPASGSSEMSLVLERLLQTFIGVERYADDVRFVNMCIRCATYYAEPIAVFHYIFNKGVGTKTAALYVAWAQYFERQAMPEQADAVYRKALEKRARPPESVLQEYRQFQARSGSQEAVSGGGPKPPSDCAPAAAPSQATVELPGSGVFYVHIVSRSETPSASGPEPDPDRVITYMYSKEALECDRSELCFEEARARTYFEKRKRRREADERQRPPSATFPSEPCPVVSEDDNKAAGTLWCQLNQMCSTLTMCAAGNPSAHPTQKAFGQEEGRSDARGEENLNTTSVPNVPNVTPGKSPRCPRAAATPSRTSPSPTRQAVDAIVGMFQAPALAEDPLGAGSALFSARKPLRIANGSSSAASERFTIYRDDASNSTSCAPARSKPAPGRGLSENLSSAAAMGSWSQQNKTVEDLTVWGEGTLASCPNNTAEFALAARCMSTPFAHRGSVGPDAMMLTGREADDNTFVRHLHKLSPIMEQSPPDEKLSDTAVSRSAASCGGHGTIVGEGLGGHQLVASSATLAQASLPPGALSFRDQTLGSTAATEPFSVLEDLEQNSRQEVVQKSVRNDAATASVRAPVSPPRTIGDRHAASPEKGRHRLSGGATASVRAPVSPPRPLANPSKECDALSDASRLLSDPWSSELISNLLSAMSPPLTSHPHCISWQRRLPHIGPKMTISMGNASLRVDRVLGQGAFATVYQATDPASSDKMVLKVQKPANPWEFYIHSQLDRRLPPSIRHLFSRARSAHVFTDGSVLLDELHSYGTLLNAVNVYKGIGDKVMPQPLVIYFTICILRMLEELHAARIIHADVKPDNFMLGQRFPDDDDFEPENLKHGLVLIDLGQSIDMDLFPAGTAFTTTCLTSGFRCTQMLSEKPWNYQTDYFGVAGTVHVMLLGTYMQVVEEDGVWRTCATFRRNPHSDMWLHLFHTLLNISACRPAPAILADLRRRLTAVLRRDYRGKMASLKSRLLVLLLENCKTARSAL